MHQRVGEIFNFGTLHLEWTTATFILVVFLITMTLMNLLLFKPLVRTIEGRESLLNSGSDEIEAANRQLEEAKAAFAKKQKDTLESISSQLQAAQEAAKAEANKVISTAETKAQATLNEAASQLEADHKQALSEAGSLAQGLSKLIQTKVLN